jgi:hypothetical protein
VRLSDYPKALGSCTAKYRRDAPELDSSCHRVDLRLRFLPLSRIGFRFCDTGAIDRRARSPQSGGEANVRVRGGPRRCRRGMTVDRLSWENVKTTECAVPAFSIDLATRVRARRPADLSSGSAIGTARQRHGSGSIAPCHEAHLLDFAAGGDGVGCRPPSRWPESADSLTPRHAPWHARRRASRALPN